MASFNYAYPDVAKIRVASDVFTVLLISGFGRSFLRSHGRMKAFEHFSFFGPLPRSLDVERMR